MSEYWLEPIDYAERAARHILCPHCSDESDRFADTPGNGLERWDNGSVVHLYRSGGYEHCVKWEAAELIRAALRDAITIARAHYGQFTKAAPHIAAAIETYMKHGAA